MHIQCHKLKFENCIAFSVNAGICPVQYKENLVIQNVISAILISLLASRDIHICILAVVEVMYIFIAYKENLVIQNVISAILISLLASRDIHICILAIVEVMYIL